MVGSKLEYVTEAKVVGDQVSNYRLQGNPPLCRSVRVFKGDISIVFEYN